MSQLPYGLCNDLKCAVVNTGLMDGTSAWLVHKHPWWEILVLSEGDSSCTFSVKKKKKKDTVFDFVTGDKTRRPVTSASI